MKRMIWFVLAIVAGAQSVALGTAAPNPEARFNRLSDEFIDGYLACWPETGTSLGLHEYDGRVSDLSSTALAAERARLQRYAAEFAALDPAALSAVARHRCQLIEGAIRDEAFTFDTEDFTTDPMTYAGPDLSVYIKRNFALLAQRVRSIIAIERTAPKSFADARANLAASLPKAYIELAIDIANGNADFLANDLATALKDVPDAALMAEFKAANNRAIAELHGYAEWLTKERLPQAHTRYALGREKYQQMLRAGEMIDLPPEKILEIGLRELQHEQAVFAAAARVVDPSKSARAVFKTIQSDHPTEASLIPDVRKHLESIRQFVIDHDLITISSAVRPRVEETLQFDRSTRMASMDPPGPFETQATEAYYYVTPPEPGWPAQQKQEWLSTFNYYTIDVITIHEVYPGHFVQLLTFNASNAGRVEKMFTSRVYTEGWAHYCEQMLLDEGFGADGDAVRAAKYRMAQSAESLLRICRLCVSIKLHCQGMTLDEAAKFFEENCYFEPKPARAEALRGTYDPGYYCYTLGKLQILKLRRDWQAQEGAAYSLKRFHDEMVGHGMPPIRLLREMMLKNPASWDEVL